MISGSWLKNLCWKAANSDNHWSLRVSHQCCQGEDSYIWVNCHESQAEKTESVTEHLTCKTAEAVAEANKVTERTSKPAHPMGRPVTPWQHPSLQGLWSLTASWPLWTRCHIHNWCLYMIWRKYCGNELGASQPPISTSSLIFQGGNQLWQESKIALVPLHSKQI